MTTELEKLSYPTVLRNFILKSALSRGNPKSVWSSVRDYLSLPLRFDIDWGLYQIFLELRNTTDNTENVTIVIRILYRYLMVIFTIYPFRAKFKLTIDDRMDCYVVFIYCLSQRNL